MIKGKDLTGKRFGRFTVLSLHCKKNYAKMWLCKCDCGNKKIVRMDGLTSGRSSSCGCLHREKQSSFMKKENPNKRPYDTSTRLYRSWETMRRRCREGFKFSKDYYDRGIRVCNEWDNDYTAFRDWSLSNGYKDNLTIDRIDNDKGYCPENCRWVGRIVQANNTRKNRFVEYNGQRKTIAEWSRELNINYRTLYMRIRRNKPMIKGN